MDPRKELDGQWLEVITDPLDVKISEICVGYRLLPSFLTMRCHHRSDH